MKKKEDFYREIDIFSKGANGFSPFIVDIMRGIEEPEEEEESDEEEVTEEGMREQLADFEVGELKDIAKEMGVTIKAKATKGAIITALVKDLEKLDETLEAMGYYAEEGSDDEGEEEEEHC